MYFNAILCDIAKKINYDNAKKFKYDKSTENFLNFHHKYELSMTNCGLTEENQKINVHDPDHQSGGPHY